MVFIAKEIEKPDTPAGRIHEGIGMLGLLVTLAVSAERNIEMTASVKQ